MGAWELVQGHMNNGICNQKITKFKSITESNGLFGFAVFYVMFCAEAKTLIERGQNPCRGLGEKNSQENIEHNFQCLAT